MLNKLPKLVLEIQRVLRLARLLLPQQLCLPQMLLRPLKALQRLALRQVRPRLVGLLRWPGLGMLVLLLALRFWGWD